MKYPKSIKIRFIEPIGKQKTIRKYWRGERCIHGDYHSTATSVIQIGGDEVDFADTDDNHLPNIPPVCIYCGKHARPDDVVENTKSISTRYNTASGKPEPGDVYYRNWPPLNWDWDNDQEQKLYCMLPNGIDWNIDSRAGNCDKKDDRTHRCWVRTGNPQDGTLHVHKDGHTCTAGAGSIQGGDYHGFLHHGYLNWCP